MMNNYQPLTVLPFKFQQRWQAQLLAANAAPGGAFRLVGIEDTPGLSSMGQRITVRVIDENGFPIPNVRVAFAYSTAPVFILEAAFQWTPLAHRAFTVYTNGGGEIDQVQGGPVKEGEPGGVTVYILEPEFSSDAVSGCGMLADHTGLLLTFQLRRTGVTPICERLDAFEARLKNIGKIVSEMMLK
jgi:hypothetical protein